MSWRRDHTRIFPVATSFGFRHIRRPVDCRHTPTCAGSIRHTAVPPVVSVHRTALVPVLMMTTILTHTVTLELQSAYVRATSRGFHEPMEKHWWVMSTSLQMLVSSARLLFKFFMLAWDRTYKAHLSFFCIFKPNITGITEIHWSNLFIQ